MQEESEEWACQAEAYRNEVDSIKAEMKSEVESKDKQIKILQQTLQVCSGIDILSKPLEIRFVLLLLLLLLPFVTNLQNRTGSDLFSPDKIRHVQFRHVGM